MNSNLVNRARLFYIMKYRLLEDRVVHLLS